MYNSISIVLGLEPAKWKCIEQLCQLLFRSFTLLREVENKFHIPNLGDCQILGNYESSGLNDNATNVLRFQPTNEFEG